MNLSVNCGVGAIFKCVVRKADTHEIVKQTPEFHNLVLDAGLSRMSVGDWIDRCVVGSGNSEPIRGQVSLDNFVSSTTSTAVDVADAGVIQVATTPHHWCGHRTWRFATGTATGNLSEIGLGWGDSNLWNRALIRDNSGNPTTITVLPDEYLDVFCEVRVYPGEGSGSFNVVDKIGNIVSSHTYLAKPRFGTGFYRGAGWYARQVKFARNTNINDGITFAVGAEPIPSEATAQIIASYATGSLAHITLNSGLIASKTITSSEANGEVHKSFSTLFTGLMCGGSFNELGVGSCGYNWQIDPPITKTNAMILTYSFSVNWSNYAP